MDNSSNHRKRTRPFSGKDVNQQEADYAVAPVPEESRRRWISIAAIMFGMVAALSSFTAGGSLVVNLSVVQSLTAAVLATLILLYLFYMPTGFIGAREGLNTYVIGEAAFGSKGTYIATALVITIIPCVGWYGIQVSIASDALTIAFGGDEGLTPWFTIMLGIVFAIPAMYGVVGMAWLNYVSIPAMAFIILYGLVQVANLTNGADGEVFQSESNETIFWGVNLLIGSLVVGASFTPDYTRWMKNRFSHVHYSGLIGILIPNVGLTAIAILFAATAYRLGVEQPWNVSEVLYTIGLPSLSLALVILLQWSTNITSSYSSGLALTRIFGWSRLWWTLIAAVVGTLLSLGGIIDYFIGFLTLLANFVSPAVGVILAEYYFVSKRTLRRKVGVYWPGIAAWLIGGVGAYLIPFFVGAINGVVISALVYTGYELMRRRGQHETAQ